MLISLEASSGEFARQVARVRRVLSTFIAANGPASPERDQQACSSRLMTVSFVPFLTGLRTELMRLALARCNRFRLCRDRRHDDRLAARRCFRCSGIKPSSD